jgi:hypothetical protein
MSGYSIGKRIYGFCKNNLNNCPYEFGNPLIGIQSQINKLITNINSQKKDIIKINKDFDTINADINDQIHPSIDNILYSNIIATYSMPQVDTSTYGYTNIRLGWYDSSFDKNLGLGNVCIGNLCNGGFYSTNIGNYNVSLGNVTLTQNVSGNYNVAVGHNSQFSCSNGSANTSLGYSALYDNVSGSYNVAIGSGAGSNNLGNYNTFLGRRAGRNANAVNYNYTTCIGTESIASGSNQIVLGTTSQNVYGGTYQTISDERDKTDIRDTILGLEFIEKLRPVDFKYKFDLVDTEIVDEINTASGNEENKKITGTRYHHGLIAQEVKKTIDSIGIDFGGYQDHSINGGKDQLTIGYSELIGPMIKCIQQLNEKIKILEDKLSKQ